MMVRGKKGREGRSQAVRWLLYLLALALCLAPPVFLNDLYGYLPVFFLLVLSLLGLICLGVLRKSLRYEDLSQAGSCVRGEEMEFQVRIENRSILVYPKVELEFYMTDLFGNSDGVTAASITLAPRESRVFTFDVKFEHLGRYSAGLKSVRISGPLGVLSSRLPGGAEHRVEVLPRVWELERVLLSDQVQVENSKAQASSMVDGADYTGVREYVAGDPIKNIHWKLSAHAAGYLTKQMELFGNTGVTVVLDLCCAACDSETGMGIFDALVETAVSVCHFAQAKGMETDLSFLDERREERRLDCRDGGGWQSLMYALPGLTFAREKYQVERLLRRAGRDLYARNNIVLCTAQVTEETVRLLRDVKLGHRTPILFFILPRGLSDRERDGLLGPVRLLDSAGIAYYVLSSASELQ